MNLQSYQNILDQLPGHLIVIDASLHLKYINDSCAEIFGTTKDQLLNQNLTAIFPSEYIDDSKVSAFLGPSNNIEMMGLHQDGKTFPVELTTKMIEWNGHGACMCWVKNIDREKHSTEHIRMMAACLDAAQEAMIMTDPKGTILFANPAFTHLTGYLNEEVIGKKPSLLKSPLHDQTFYVSMWKQILRGQIWKGDVINRKKDGSAYEAELLIAPVFDQKKNIEGFIAVHKDITKYKNHERQLNATVERLTNSMKDISIFSSRASHDLRSPLSSIKGFAQLVLEDPELEKHKEYANRIIKSSEHLSELIHDILTYARVDLEAQPFERIEPDRLIRGLLDAYEYELQTGQVLVDIQEIPQFDADQRQFNQLMQNLIENSIKYGPKDKRTELAIKGRLVEKEQKIEITLQDNGIGIPKEHLQSIFHAYTRLHGETEYPGTGMGLSICRRIVERHHGSILALNNEKGSGTIFKILFPKSQV